VPGPACAKADNAKLDNNIMSHAHPNPRAGSRPQSDPVEYQAISGLAIAALLLGIASVSALAGLVLWGVPVLGVVTSLVALLRIERAAGALAGRSAARWGLALSVFFGAVAVAHFISNERMLANRAEQVARQWFAALAAGNPPVARQLGLPAKSRARISDPAQLWNYYRDVVNQRRDIEQFVAEPLIHTLLALDGQATVRLYANRGVSNADQQTIVAQTYAVTYEDDGARKTFFVNLTLERNLQRGADKADWRVLKYAGGVDPE
jgi:hypothetical protein